MLSLRPPPVKKIRKNRTPGIVFVVVLHAFLGWAFVTGLAQQTVELLAENLEAAVVSEETVDEAPPPPPPPDFEPPPPVVPPPQVIIDLAPRQTANTAIQAVVDRPAPPPPVPAAPPPPPPITPPSARGNANAVGAADYPAISVRLREQGRVILRICVLGDGSVGDVMLVTSSGFSRLDDASITMVKRKFRYNPATQGGRPIEHCQNEAVTWQLR